MDGKVLSLVRNEVSEETVRALEYLLREARAGRIAGISYIAFHRIDDFTVDATGACRWLPHVTRGMLATLDDELAKLDPKES